MVDIEKEQQPKFEAWCLPRKMKIAKFDDIDVYKNEYVRENWFGWLACAEANQLEIQRLRDELEIVKAMAVKQALAPIEKG